VLAMTASVGECKAQDLGLADVIRNRQFLRPKVLGEQTSDFSG